MQEGKKINRSVRAVFACMCERCVWVVLGEMFTGLPACICSGRAPTGRNLSGRIDALDVATLGLVSLSYSALFFPLVPLEAAAAAAATSKMQPLFVRQCNYGANADEED